MNEKIERRVDDLGRILIPKEIRRKFGIKENDVMQITEKDGKIIIEKVNSNIEEIADSISHYISAVSDMLSCDIIVTDLKVVTNEYRSKSGAKNNVFRLGESLSMEFVSMITHKVVLAYEGGLDGVSYNGTPNVTVSDKNSQRNIPYAVSYICNKNNDVVGSVVIYGSADEVKVMCNSIAAFIMTKM